MAFPSNPTNNQLSTRFGRQYIYDSAKGVWKNHIVEPILNTANIDNLVDVDTTTVTPTDGQALVWDNDNSVWKPGTVASGGSGLEYQSVQTADFTASAGKLYPVDTTSNAVTVTLPASPSTGDRIGVIDYAGTAGTNSIQLDPNGLKIAGSSDSVNIANIRAAVTIIYTGSDMGWVAESGFNQSSLLSSITVEYLVVAGGGSGGRSQSGGGGAGGFLTGTFNATPSVSYAVTVGAGAPSQTTQQTAGVNGSLSSFDTISAAGGGGGGAYGSGPGLAGGSGGGAGSSPGAPYSGGAATSSQGNSGGAVAAYAAPYRGGGGGGAGANGGAGDINGNGGVGLSSSISGTALYYAGGGGAGAYNATPGAGGNGGGGNGNNSNADAESGQTNTGGGGGGTGYPGGNSGGGGSGVVVIATLSSKPISNIGAGLTYTLDTSSRAGYYVYKFTAGTGSISW